MPTFEVHIDSPNPTTFSSPHELHFSLPVNDTNHSNYPIFLKSLAAKFATTVNLPTKVEIQLSNLHADPEFNTITFPIPGSISTAPSFHYHTDMHLGDVSHQRTIKGVIRLYGNGIVQIPSAFNLNCFVDSEYM